MTLDEASKALAARKAEEIAATTALEEAERAIGASDATDPKALLRLRDTRDAAMLALEGAARRRALAESDVEVAQREAKRAELLRLERSASKADALADVYKIGEAVAQHEREIARILRAGADRLAKQARAVEHAAKLAAELGEGCCVETVDPRTLPAFVSIAVTRGALAEQPPRTSAAPVALVVWPSLEALVENARERLELREPPSGTLTPEEELAAIVAGDHVERVTTAWRAFNAARAEREAAWAAAERAREELKAKADDEQRERGSLSSFFRASPDVGPLAAGIV